MNLDAVVLVGRRNPEKPGVSPFSPTGSGICIHPDGVVATCCHTLVNFLRAWNPHDLPRGPDTKVVIEDAEPQERPAFSFLSREAFSGLPAECESKGLFMLSFQANPVQDIAVVELGGTSEARPLPYVAKISSKPPMIGERVEFAGHFQGSEVLYDQEGNVKGWPLVNDSATVVACLPDGFVFDYPVRPGMSGSGICNQTGTLVGIVVESWPAEHAAQRIGLKKSLGFAAYAQWLIPQYRALRSAAENRVAYGELPWCGGS